jgi:protein-L-isoaspartate O-methyltransferase
MALVLDSSGLVYDNATGETVSSAVDRDIQEAAAKYVWGQVLEIGLGNGFTRAALADSENVTKLKTIEIRSDLISLWTAEAGIESMPMSTLDVEHTLVQGNGLDSLVTPPFRLDSVLFDVAGAELDSAWIAALHAYYVGAGGRVVAISTDPDYAMAGFAAYRMEGPGPGGSYVFVLDRYDPDNGVGTARTDIWVPGHGYMAAGDLEDLEVP